MTQYSDKSSTGSTLATIVNKKASGGELYEEEAKRVVRDDDEFPFDELRGDELSQGVSSDEMGVPAVAAAETLTKQTEEGANLQEARWVMCSSFLVLLVFTSPHSSVL